MKKPLFVVSIVVFAALVVMMGRSIHPQSASAQSSAGPLYSSKERLVLSRDKASGRVSGTLEKGTIAVAYVNLWASQNIQNASTLYTPPAAITEVQPVILYSHCDLPYKFSIQAGKLVVSGSCTSANWAEPPLEVVVLYSK